MKKVICSLTLLGLVALFTADVPARAAEVTASATLSTAYVFRGVTFNDQGVVQPSIDIAHPSGVNFNIWANLDIGDYNNAVEEGEFSEIDLTVSYALPVEEVDVSVGAIYYAFPQGSSDTSTTELYVSVGKEVLDGISLASTMYYDIDEVNDVYANFSATVDFAAWWEDLEEGPFSLSTTAGIGVMGKEMAEANSGIDSGFSEWQISLDGSYAIREDLEIGAFVAYVESVDDDVLPDSKTEVDVYGGISLTHMF